MTTKRKLIYIAFLVAVWFVAAMLLAPATAGKTEAHAQVVEDPVTTELKQRREVYAHALEWCESKGKRGAINKVDRDGTPSYYALQFKPGTFLGYAVKYDLLPATTTDAEVMVLMEDYDLTRAILWRMFDDPDVKWSREFPDCVNNKIGPPPK